jgi:putative inorganic carbon (HCO3(-)) transporter
MRDALVFLLVFGSLPFIFKRPSIGVLMFTWLSLMNPHRLTYGPAFDFPFAAIVAGFTAVCLLISKQPRHFPKSPLTVTLVLFAAWMTITSVFALEPLLVWREWSRVLKTLFMIAISIAALNNEKDLKRFVWVVVCSLAIYGVKGGIFTIMKGGNYKVFGPSGSYIEENNGMALAMVTVLPLLWSLRSQVNKNVFRLGIAAAAVCTAIAAMGSYSRGALLGGGAMLFCLWLRSPKKLQTGILVIVIGAVISAVMPAQWFERMDTIGEYKEDGSAQGRFNAWKFAFNVAVNNPLGGGFNVFSARMFQVYAPDPANYHAAHSIYFQVLGEHGFVGLALFLLLLVFAWRTGTRVIKLCNNDPDRLWAADLARMAQVSLVGYAISGAFLSLAYFDLFYDIIIILVVMEKVFTVSAPATVKRPAPPEPRSLRRVA